jgi:hypothetical protein
LVPQHGVLDDQVASGADAIGGHAPTFVARTWCPENPSPIFSQEFK